MESAGISRRRLLALSAAGLGAASVGCSPARKADRKPSAIVVGAGLAGLGAAATLRAGGVTPMVLEARDRIGGRVHTVERFDGVSLDLGAAWIHDSRGNPLTEVARRRGLDLVATDYGRDDLRRTTGKSVTAGSLRRAQSASDSIIDSLYSLADSAPESKLRSVLEPAIERETQRGVDEEVLRWLLGVEIPLDLAAGVDQLTVGAFSEGTSWNGGPDLMLRGGAGQLVAVLAEGTQVRTGVEVVAVERAATTVTVRTAKGESITADGCVMAVPLGVLKAGSIEFGRSLDPGARAAIERLGVGVLDKVFLSWATRWWPARSTQLGTVGQSIDRTISTFPLDSVTGRPVTVSFVGGSHAEALEREGGAAMLSAAGSSLVTGFGVTPGGSDAELTCWGKDRFAGGSYSYLGPEASSGDREALASLQGRLIFAGEHTSTLRPATMDGAWLAGRAAGRDLAGVLHRS